MNIKNQIAKFLFLIIIGSMIGCQSNPGVPDIDSHAGDPVTEANSAGDTHNLLGYYAIAIEPLKSEVTILPLRTAEWHLNMTGVLNSTMGVSAAIVPGESDLSNGLIVIDITLEHPFGTKPQFAGFDVKGILITPGSFSYSSYVFADVDETRLENADGYTRWWNPTEFTTPGIFGYIQGSLSSSPLSALTATVNPYKYFADILYPTSSLSVAAYEPLDSDQGRGVFTAGSSNTRRYNIRFEMDPGPQIVYGYAVDCSWVAPTPNPPFAVPDDFPIEANQPEAWRVEFVEHVNSLYYDSESGTSGGILKFYASVYDWQGHASGNIGAEIQNVLIYAPDLYSGGAPAVYLNETFQKARYTADVTDLVNVTSAGETLVICGASSMDGSTYKQTGNPAPDETLITYQVLIADIIDPACEPDANNQLSEAEEIGIQGNVTGELCDTVDIEDWYWFEIPAGYEASGEIRWYNDADSSELELYDAQGNYLIDSCGGAVNLDVIDVDWLFMPPGKYYLRTFVTQIVNPPPGAMLYYLETDLELNYVEPLSPVDVTPMSWDCAATWLGTAHDLETRLMMTGSAGTWCYAYDSLGFLCMGRTWDGFGSNPGYYHPYLYIWDYPTGGTVDLIDYSVINSPVKHESVLTLTDTIEAMVMNSTHLYIVVDDGANSYIRVYDYATDPTNPTYVGGLQTIHNVKRLALIDPEGPHTSLVAMAQTKMEVYDVENPASIVAKVLQTLASGFNLDMCVTGEYIVKTYVNWVPSGRLQVSKYNNVTGLEPWGTISLSEFGEHVTAKGVYAYVSCPNYGIYVINFLFKNGLVQEVAIPTSSQSRYIHATENYLLNIQDGPGVVEYDRSNPAVPVESAMTECLNRPFDVEIKDDYAFYVEGVQDYGTLTAIRVDDPPAEYIHAEYPLEGLANKITGYGSLFAVGSSEVKKIWIYDYTTNPLVINQFYTDNVNGNIIAMEMTNVALYVSLDTGVMRVYDISLAPTIFKKPDFPLLGGYAVGDFAIQPGINCAYALRYQEPQVDIYDISDPYNWSFLQNLSAGNDTMSGDIYNNYLYILTTDTLNIYDLSQDPSGPQFLSNLTMPYPGQMAFMDVEGQYAYVSDQGQPVKVVSVYPPDSPEVMGYPIPDTDGITTGIAVKDNFLYVMHYVHGVRVYELY